MQEEVKASTSERDHLVGENRRLEGPRGAHPRGPGGDDNQPEHGPGRTGRTFIPFLSSLSDANLC